MKYKKLVALGIALLAILFISSPSWSGIEDRLSDVKLDKMPYNRINLPEVTAPSGNPAASRGWIYLKDNGGVSDLYFEDDAGTVFNLTGKSSGVLYGGLDIANGVWGSSSGINFEGSSADAYESILTVENPTADRTVTLPNYTGSVPIIVGNGATKTSAVNTTSDVTGSSVTIPANWFTPGKVLHWVLSGTKAGTNAVLTVYLYLKDAVVATLTSGDTAAGDWLAEFWLVEYSDTGNQKIFGRLTVNGKSTIFDFTTTLKTMTTDLVAKLQIKSSHANDTVTSETVMVDHFYK